MDEKPPAKPIHSNYELYLMYRYFSLGMFVVLITFLFDIDASDLQSLIMPAALSLIFLLLFFIALGSVFYGEVTKEELKFDDIIVKWVEVKTIFRFGSLYFLKTKDDEWFLFPVQRVIRIFGESISQTELDQLIQLMKRKHNLS